MDSSGLLLIDKKEGMTSRAIDNAIGRRFATHRVGHLGTLDPFATGLLIVGVNKGTKLLPYLLDEEKTYQAKLKLGEKTLTGDNTSEVIESKEVPSMNEEVINKALTSLLGKQEQIPPMTSAKKINGEPLYKKAHQGIEVERKAVQIEVFEAELNYFNENEIVFTVKVSKGTYIRVLAEELANRLNTLGHLTSLRRLKVGNIDVNKAKEAEIASFIDPLELLSHLKIVDIRHDLINYVKDGRPLNLALNEDKILIVSNKEPLAVYKKKEEGVYVSERGLF